MVKNPPANTGDARDMGSIPGLGRPPGVANVTPFQNSCLEDSMGRGVWQVPVQGLRRVRLSTAHIQQVSTHEIQMPYKTGRQVCEVSWGNREGQLIMSTSMEREAVKRWDGGWNDPIQAIQPGKLKTFQQFHTSPSEAPGRKDRNKLPLWGGILACVTGMAGT